MLDTHYAVETPEGVAVNLKPAGPGVRAAAWLLDCLIRYVSYIGVGMVMSFVPAVGDGLFYIFIFLAEWFYPVYFEVMKGGQTPGKKRMNLCVVCDNGTPVDWHRSILRNLLRFADFLPLFYGFGLLSCLFTTKFQRLGDLVAGTLVVYQEDTAYAPAAAQTSQAPVAPSFPLSLAEQRALINFRDRSDSLHTKRQEELAQILEPLTGVEGEKGRQVLCGHADWLQGERK